MMLAPLADTAPDHEYVRGSPSGSLAVAVTVNDAPAGEVASIV